MDTASIWRVDLPCKVQIFHPLSLDIRSVKVSKTIVKQHNLPQYGKLS